MKTSDGAAAPIIAQEHGACTRRLHRSQPLREESLKLRQRVYCTGRHYVRKTATHLCNIYFSVFPLRPRPT